MGLIMYVFVAMIRLYPLARDVVEGASANLNWEGLNVLAYIDLGQYLDAVRFSELSLRGLDSCKNTNRLTRLIAHGAFNL